MALTKQEREQRIADFQKVRRYVIVQMNKQGADNIERATVLQAIALNLSAEQIHATAEAIRSGLYRDFDLGHDIMGLANKEKCFLPRIKSIAEVS